MKYQEVKEIKEKIEKEIEQEKEKEETIQEIKEKEKDAENKIKEFEDSINKIIQRELKKEVIETNILDKEKIFDDIKQFSKTNLFTLGAEPQAYIGKINSFGIFGNHRYDFLDCENFLFFMELMGIIN